MPSERVLRPELPGDSSMSGLRTEERTALLNHLTVATEEARACNFKGARAAVEKAGVLVSSQNAGFILEGFGKKEEKEARANMFRHQHDQQATYQESIMLIAQDLFSCSCSCKKPSR
mgnify:CR=1 FL=1